MLPLTSMHLAHLSSSERHTSSKTLGISLMRPAESTIRPTRSSFDSTGVAYTRSFMVLHKKKSKASKALHLHSALLIKNYLLFRFVYYINSPRKALQISLYRDLEERVFTNLSSFQHFITLDNRFIV